MARQEATTGSTAARLPTDAAARKTSTSSTRNTRTSSVGRNRTHGNTSANDSSSAQVTVKPATLQLTITPNATSYRVGQWIGIDFAAINGGQPAAGAAISFTVTGATGAVIEQGSATADSKGHTSTVISRYLAAGGYGTYTVQATASQKGVTTTAQQTFNVISSRGIY